MVILEFLLFELRDFVDLIQRFLGEVVCFFVNFKFIYKMRSCVELMYMKWNLFMKGFFFGQMVLFDFFVFQRLVVFVYGVFMEKVLKIVFVCC